VLRNTFVPNLSLNFVGISAAVALLGATISPYTVFWQVGGETEESRPGTRHHQVHLMGADIASGVITGNLVSYFIILCTAATLFAHHQTISTAADAARALQPLLGPLAKYLFALGLIGAGLVAIPVLLASTGYVVTGTFGWAGSLWQKPWQSKGFYLVLSLALIASLALAFLHINPIQLMFWANILQSFLAPILLILLLLLGNRRTIMHGFKLGWLPNLGLLVTTLILIVGVVLLVAGLVTGQGG
jgi:Mn2+/Fe2+ NRAMP family transporter